MNQLFTGGLSDRIGREGLIASGMWVQAVGIELLVRGRSFSWRFTAVALLGLGTGMVYPTLLAAISDVAPSQLARFGSWCVPVVAGWRLYRRRAGVRLPGRLAGNERGYRRRRCTYFAVGRGSNGRHARDAAQACTGRYPDGRVGH